MEHYRKKSGELADAGSRVFGFGNGQVVRCQSLAVDIGQLADENLEPKNLIYGSEVPIFGSL